MELLLERLSPGQIVAVISIVCGSVVALTMVVAIAKYQLQWLSDDTALRKEKQQAELALKEKLLERGVPVGGASLDSLLAPEAGMFEADDETVRLNAELAKRFGSLDIEDDARGSGLEEALTRALAADNARKASIIKVMDELLGIEAPHNSILAAVRPLCERSKKDHAACA